MTKLLDKWMLASMTVWGVIGTLYTSLSAIIGPMLGFEISPGDWLALDDAVKSMIDAAFVLATSLLAVWGRFRAKSKITVMPGGTAPVATAKK